MLIYICRYLGSHYELLREDAYSTLRDATLSVRMTPDMDDLTEICIYENVCDFHLNKPCENKADEQTNIVDRSALLDIHGLTTGYVYSLPNRFRVADWDFLPSAGWCKMLLFAQPSTQEDSMGKL